MPSKQLTTLHQPKTLMVGYESLAETPNLSMQHGEFEHLPIHTADCVHYGCAADAAASTSTKVQTREGAVFNCGGHVASLDWAPSPQDAKILFLAVGILMHAVRAHAAQQFCILLAASRISDIWCARYHMLILLHAVWLMRGRSCR